ncbi:hypothetical protein V6U81_07610 [Micromonospora sp. CPCC 205711]|uniref:hypothetical protein n=1 Tax=Micromonospora sp. CPCC 205547 TaxID=3122400 RepID=UPI002FF00AD9
MDPAGSARSARVAALFDRVAGTYDNVGVPWFTRSPRDWSGSSPPGPAKAPWTWAAGGERSSFRSPKRWGRPGR